MNSLKDLRTRYFDNVLEYDLQTETSEADLMPAAEGVETVKVDDMIVHSFCARIEQEADKSNGSNYGDDYVTPFAIPGKALYDHLTGKNDIVKEYLRSPEKPLMISTDNPGIPWELLHDGEEFIGIRNVMSRRLHRVGRPSYFPSKRKPEWCLIIANPTCDPKLEEMEKQARELVQWLREAGIKCSFINREVADKTKVLEELGKEKYDIFYYCGHVELEEDKDAKPDEPKKKYALILNDGPLFTSFMGRGIKNISIAFINGCWAAAELIEETKRVESITTVFLNNGTNLVIGNLFQIPPKGAGVFAETFFEEMLAGEQAGVAFRTARVATRDNRACRAAWASFVMYGDPRLQIVKKRRRKEIEPEEVKPEKIKQEYFISKQDLPKWLPKENFETSCWRVIEDAIIYARPIGGLGSPFLFAAMLKGDDRRLWEGLAAQRASPEILQKIFDEALKVVEDKAPSENISSKLHFSRSVERILKQSQNISKERGDEQKTRERDLQIAFVVKGGGSTGELLRKAGVDFKELELFLRNEPVELDNAGKQAIDAAFQAASELGSNVCGTPHLFLGLVSLEGGLTQEILAEQGVTMEQVKEAITRAYTRRRAATPQQTTSEIQRSSNLNLILQEAERIARADENAQYIGEEHLLSAFLIVGGGSVSQVLEDIGIDLDEMKDIVNDIVGVVEPSTPDELGPLRQDECDAECWHVIEQSIELALRSGESMVSTTALFLALLKGKEGCADAAFRKQGVSPGHLRAGFQRVLAPKTIVEQSKIEQATIAPSKNVSQILQLAKEKAENQEQVTEALLWQAFVEHGGGSTGKFLREKGVVWEALVSEIFLEDGEVDLEQFDEDAEEALQSALRAADEMRQGAIRTPQLFLGLLSIEDGCAQSLLLEQGLDPMAVHNTLERFYTSTQTSSARDELKLEIRFLSPRVKRILAGAESIARSEQNERITERHIVLSFLRDGGGDTAKRLIELGANLPAMRRSAESSVEEGLTSVRATPLLNKLGRDLTQEAQEGRLRRVIGREKEIEEIEEILLRQTKNAPVLIGDAGVGKTAIVEGFAQKIVAGQVSSNLRGMRLIELPVSELVSGTNYRGDFEKRMERVIQEVERSKVILFIDELHTLVGAGAAGRSSLDASNILKPFLARGDVKCIGATTIEEYGRYIEPERALERRFLPIHIEEPTPEEVLEILHGLKKGYETHFEVQITDEAMESAVKLSVRYLPERRLPDKACDVLEQACASAKIKRKGEEGTEVTEPVHISKADIAKVISRMTGIRLGDIEDDEQHRLKSLEESLKRRVVGQDRAISSVSGAIRSARIDIGRPNRPKAVFIFAGPSGVGKTELAKALAAELFGADDALIQLNMSEFMEPHSVSKLIGAPAGYIGHDREGQLTSVLRRKPDCIVLLDEFEKADAQVANLFLQLFDEGRITDAQGHVVNAKNALFILTCNIGADSASESGMGFQRAISEDAESFRKKVVAQVRKHFPTEFINRVDEIIVFDHLGEEQIREIANREIALLIKQLRDKHNITVTFEEEAIVHLVGKGYDRAYGARALLRAIDDNVRKPLSNMIVNDSPSVVTVTIGEDGIKFSAEEFQESPERIEE